MSNKSVSSKFSYLLFVVIMVFSLNGCANRDFKRIFVYGFGTMNVPRDAGVAEIDDLVAQQYGSNLFWSPK